MPEEGVRWMPKEEVLTSDEFARVVQAGVNLGISKVRITGGEPLVRRDIVEIVRKISRIPGVKDLNLTTNAMLLEKYAQPMADAGLMRVNISLDTLDPDKYHTITRFGEYSTALAGIHAAEKAGLKPVKINTVVVRGMNDDELVSIAKLSLDHPWHIRFIELMPVANDQDWGMDLPTATERYFSVQEMIQSLESLNLEPVSEHSSGPERTFRIPGGLGTVGFICPVGNKFCKECNRIRLTADGHLRSCLLVDGEVSIREALRNGEDLEPYIRQAVWNKPEGHLLDECVLPVTRHMSQIGG
jgi:cyclic pyranopterin phosphate synthase